MNAGDHAKESKPGILKGFLSFLLMIAIVLVCSWALRTYVFEPFKVPSASMEKTIMTGDMVFTEKISYNFGEPKAGDLVVFDDPQIPSRVLVKRIIATEGQTIDFIDGQVYVDGVLLDEPYTSGAETYPLISAANVSISYPYTVPEDMVWVMGDNRTNSSDSRYFGPVEEDSVFGKAILVYWPLDRFGTLE